MSETLFITGTDTGCGKTWATVALARHYAAQGKRVACFKPVASGCRETPAGWRNDDAEQLMAAANVTLPYAVVNPIALPAAIAPHLAARDAGRAIVPAQLAGAILGVEADIRLVEGAGGWMVPLGEDVTTADLARSLGAEVVLVVAMRLGCINHALLTARAIVTDGCRLRAWIANAMEPAMPRLEDNVDTLAARLPAPLLLRL